jgi:hypothetical protein
MKTDIFKDLVPLLEMDNKQIKDLAIGIIEENKQLGEKFFVQQLLIKVQELSSQIFMNYERI